MQKPETLREKLSQLMFVRIGSNLPPIRTVEEDAFQIEELLGKCPIGGLLLFNGRREHTANTLAHLQSCSDIPLLVGADIERGVGQQLHGYPLFPHAMAFSAVGDPERAVYEFSRQSALLARASGIQITLSPVADVNIDPQNPIISTRAFGNSPDTVAKLVSAFVQGAEAGGLLSTAKHFPGHGNTHEDSHHELPTVHSSTDELWQVELPPFKAAIDAGVPLVMTAHVRYPSLDGTGKCATLSQPILVDLLRNELGFQGAVVSDSFLMEGVKLQATNEGDLATQALNAGVDVLLDVAEPVATLEQLEAAVEAGRLAESRIEEAFERLWKLKTATFGDDLKLEEVGGENPFSLDTTEQLVAQVAAQSITQIGASEDSLPLDPGRSLCAVFVRTHSPPSTAGKEPLEDLLKCSFPDCTFLELGPDADEHDYTSVAQAAKSADQLLIAMVVKPAAWHRFGLLPSQQSLVEQLLEHPRCVLASLGAKEPLDEFDSSVLKLCGYSDVPASQRALVNHLAEGTT